jgi:hypothetical protein
LMISHRFINSSFKQEQLSPLLFLQFFAVFVILKSLFERLKHLQCSVVIFSESQSNGICDPVLLDARLPNQNLTTSFSITFVITKLDLKISEVSQDILVGRIVSKSVQVSLTCLIIVSKVKVLSYWKLTCFLYEGFHTHASKWS